MTIYTLKAPVWDQPLQFAVVWATYDKDTPSFDASVLAPFNTIYRDEEAQPALCAGIVNTLHQMDVSGHQKYYVNGAGALFERSGWVAQRPPRR